MLAIAGELRLPGITVSSGFVGPPNPMDALAERSKAVAQGAIPQGRGLEPHRHQSSALELPWSPLANVWTIDSKIAGDVLLKLSVHIC